MSLLVLNTLLIAFGPFAVVTPIAAAARSLCRPVTRRSRTYRRPVPVRSRMAVAW